MHTDLQHHIDELKEKLDVKSLEPLFYDLYFTAFKKNYQVSALYYKKKNGQSRYSLAKEYHIRDCNKFAI